MTASWRHLVMLSYDIDPDILMPMVPTETQLDMWNGRCFVSLVGFMFEDSRLCGVPIPFHGSFEEVNLRFYVKRVAEGETRRAVVFIKELVPKRAVAMVAKMLYSEPYLALPMSHEHEKNEGRDLQSAVYRWTHNRQECEIGIEVDSPMALPDIGSIEEFIAEHYWGYTRLDDTKTAEYRVTHPQWRVARAERAWRKCDAASLYGEQFEACLAAKPVSAFLADGSEIAVFPRKVLRGAELR